uniref:Uncharacterized protein n=1 Tax=Anguilla anguilla TaxID=7936 RepID=A0A0E9SHR6_ANGAN
MRSWSRKESLIRPNSFFLFMASDCLRCSVMMRQTGHWDYSSPPTTPLPGVFRGLSTVVFFTICALR